MTIQANDFWLADIPFTDGSASRILPVLVLWLLDCLEQSLLFRWLGASMPTDAQSLRTIWALHVKPRF